MFCGFFCCFFAWPCVAEFSWVAAGDARSNGSRALFSLEVKTQTKSRNAKGRTTGLFFIACVCWTATNTQLQEDTNGGARGDGQAGGRQCQKTLKHFYSLWCLEIIVSKMYKYIKLYMCVCVGGGRLLFRSQRATQIVLQEVDWDNHSHRTVKQVFPSQKSNMRIFFSPLRYVSIQCY